MNSKPRSPLCVGRAQWTPETGKPLAKFAVPERKIDEESRRITFTISTAARDRDGDTIDVAGWELEDYRKNPVVLWAHEGWSPPVARAESVMAEQGRLVSIARFATREQYPFADTIYELYKGGFLNATSVGFEPLEMELMDGLEPGDIGFRFRRQKLLEYSAVPIPSNPEALVIARGTGIDVKPCEEWIERVLDERRGAGMTDILNRSYIALRGKLHPVMQDALAARNAAALKAKDTAKMDMDDDEDEDDRPKVVTDAAEDGHTHEFRYGEAQTEAGGEDGHVHAVTYNEDGTLTVEGAEGHTHAASAPDKNGEVDSEEEVAVQTPSNDPLSPINDQPENQRAAETPVEKAITDWPQPGMSLPVSLLTSEYRAFPVAEAKALQEDWPEIWALGEGPGEVKGEDAIRTREAWAAKNVDAYDLPGVVSQVRHLVRGSRGIEHMRKVLSLAKEAVMNERDKAKGLTPEEIDQVADLVVERAVIPALEKALRHHSGRVS